MNEMYGVNLTQEEKEMLSRLFFGGMNQEKKIKFSVNVVGRQFCESTDNFKLGATVFLKREPSNAHDTEAIAVYVGRKKVGYVANSVKTMIQGCCSAGYVSGLLDAYGVTSCPVGKVKYFCSWATIVEVTI